MKKILSVALVLIMMLSVFSVTASAESTADYYDVRVGDVYYSMYDDGAYVVGYDVDPDNIAPAGAITIPETVSNRGKKYTVVGIETEAFYNSLFTSITLPSTIKHIGDYAFSTCDYLEEVIIPSNCYLDFFGLNVFVATPFEAEIYSKDETIFGKNVLYSYTGNADEYVIPEEITILANNCFFMSGVKNVVFNDSITEIPYYAFASCRNLKEIIIPDSVEYIGDGAFLGCESLIEIVTKPTIRSGKEAAAYLEKLRSIFLYCDTSYARSDRGQIRCDVNISLRPKGSKEFGTKVEMKNIMGFNFTKAKREKSKVRICLTGASGGGKTTLCHLIPKFYNFESFSTNNYRTFFFNCRIC